MSIKILSWLFVHFAVPQPVVNWADQAHDSIKISAEGREELLDRCLESGIEIRYRFEIRYCQAGKYWFDDCENEWVEIKSLKYDPIKETYQLKSDRLGDDDIPLNSDFTSRTEAVAALSTISRITVEKIARGENIKTDSRSYVGIRVVSDCKGGAGSTMLEIAYYATFGLVKVSRFDSGWVAFYLNK